jgi:hypothetical protein
MPYLPIASRYIGYSQAPMAVSPGLLSPATDDENSPAFDPTLAAASANQTQTPLPPPPQQQPPPQGLNDTAASAQIANPPPLVPLNGQPPAGGSARDTGVKQLLAKPMAPPTPPGVQASAAPADASAAPATPPIGLFGPVPTIGAPDAGGAAATATPSASETLDPRIQKDISDYQANLEDHKHNESPKSNWLQRLSTALLALTRFAPYSNQIVHPKWTEQENEYQRKQNDILGDIKTVDTANTAQASVEQKEGTAAWRRSQELAREADAAKINNPHYGMTQVSPEWVQANYPSLPPDQDGSFWLTKEQKDKLTPAADATKKYYDDHIKDLADKLKAQRLAPGQQAPTGYLSETLPNPHNAGQQETWVYPPPIKALSQFHPAAAADLVKRKLITQEQADQPVEPDTYNSLVKTWEGLSTQKPQAENLEEQNVTEFQNDPKNANADGSKPSITQARAAIAKQVKPPEEASWQLGEQDGKSVFYNPKTREVVDAAGIQKPGAPHKEGEESNKIYSPALDAAERYNTMSQNYLDGVKNHDQQAMLSLLANHLGMTLGGQKGARLNQSIIDEAVKSRPWLQGITSKVDSNGLLTGVTLTPQQMKQMVDLGHDRYVQELTKARALATNAGITKAPKMTPNKATIAHYFAMANNDPQKAAQLMAAEGWGE